MHIGIQLEAPDGFEELEKGTTYHFLRSDTTLGRVLLVRFNDNGKSQQANLVTIRQNRFEYAIHENEIGIAENQTELPPWLVRLEGIDLNLMDAERQNAIKPHKKRVDERLIYIYGAIKDIENIFSAEKPEHVLNQYARRCKPVQNETRFRLWFFLYICFGRNVWALLPPFIRAGQWDRFRFTGKKFGRLSISRGPKSGHACSEDMIKKIEKGYLKYSGLNVSMMKIYVKTMRLDFGCVVSGTGSKMKKIRHPKGEPFPSYDQFHYRVIKKFGLSEIQKTLYGKVRHRTRKSASKGRFSAQLTNLMERIESDGYYTKEVPRGFLEGSSLQPLCVVRSRCSTSGMLLGIGFSFGKERSDAYRMALFSMAVPKDYFCSLFGITISEEAWPSQGLPPFSTVDRGPGSKANLIEDFNKQFPIREMSPSWSGQSKATIESSHPKNIHSEGQPTYFQSDLNPVALARREILRLIKDNSSLDMSERMLPDWDREQVQPSPIGIWNHLNSRFRTCAQPMSINEAIRTFLTPIDVTVKKDGIWFNQQKYDSNSLRETEIVDKVASGQSIKIKGYVLDLCVRHIWVEVNKKIIQVDAQLSIRDDNEQLYMSLAELVERAKVKNATAAEFREHQKAAALQVEQAFQDEVGQDWDQGKRRAGKPKRGTPLAKRESSEARNRFKSGEAI
ncbi:MAG: hypothetical protein ACYCY8_04035 [Burkholderiales bacterium]